MPKFRQLGGGGETASGWNSAFSSMSAPFIYNNTTAFEETDDFWFVGYQATVTSFNLLRRSAKVIPPTWSNVPFPIALNICQRICVYDNNTLFVSGSVGGNARVYNVDVGTGTFTDLNFPVNTVSDNISGIIRHPFDSDVILVGKQNTNVTGTATIYEYRISTLTWTVIGGAGNGWTETNDNSSVEFWKNSVLNGRLYVLVNGGLVNVAQVYESSPLASGSPYTWTKVAGDSLNSSWATGTFRNGLCSVYQGKLYAGIGGATNGDAELWTRSAATGLWSKIGGDGVGGSWTTQRNISRQVAGRGPKLTVAASAGTDASATWEYDLNTQAWVQIAGNSLNGTWPTTIANMIVNFVTARGQLVIGGGNSSLNSDQLAINDNATFGGGGAGALTEFRGRRARPVSLVY